MIIFVYDLISRYIKLCVCVCCKLSQISLIGKFEYLFVHLKDKEFFRGIYPETNTPGEKEEKNGRKETKKKKTKEI